MVTAQESCNLAAAHLNNMAHMQEHASAVLLTKLLLFLQHHIDMGRKVFEQVSAWH